MFFSALGLLLIMLLVPLGGEHGWPVWSCTAMAVGLFVLAVFIA